MKLDYDLVNARSCQPGESLDVYSADITRLVIEAFPNYDDNGLNGKNYRLKYMS